MSTLADLGNLKTSTVQDIERFHYQFTDSNGNFFDLYINAANTVVSPDGIHNPRPNTFTPFIVNSQNPYSGSVNGYGITSTASFNKPDFAISTQYASNNGTGPHDPLTGLDTHGISFVTSDGTAWNIAYSGTGSDSTIVSSAHVGSSAFGEITQSNVVNSSFNLSLTPICYLPGTLITTTDGDVPVEELKIGDLLPTHSGKVLPVKWIGRQNIDGRFYQKSTILFALNRAH